MNRISTTAMLPHRFQGLKKPVSAICLGTADYGSGIPESEAFALLDRFATLGGNFIDTAHVYGAWDKNGTNGGLGNSEVVIGRWMRQRGCRKQMVIGTKGGHPDFDTGASGMSRHVVHQHLQESLERLQTDHIDIYWLHRDDRSMPVTEILGWMKDAVDAGVIRMLACSHWRRDRLAEARQAAQNHGLPLMQASQIAWSLAQDKRAIHAGPYGEQLSMDAATWAFHCQRQIPVAPYSSQAGGFFAAKYDHLDFSAPDFPKPGLTRKYGCDLNYRRRCIARELAAEKGCTANQIALAYLLHQPFPVLPIVGPRNLAQLDDSLGAVAVPLTGNEVEMLRRGASK